MKVLVFTNAKGGSASTTSIVNCAAWLALQGHHALIIDTDHQADAGKLLGVPSGDHVTRYLRGKSVSNEDTGRDGLRIMPGNGTLATVEHMLRVELDIDPNALHDVAARFREAGDNFDYTLIDTAKKGELQQAAILAADILVIPTMLDLASASNTVTMVRLARNLMQEMGRIVILPVGLDGRRQRTQRQVIAQLGAVASNESGAPVRSYIDGIPQCAAIQNAGIARQTIWEFDAHSEAAKAYDGFMQWLTEENHG